MEDSPLQYFFIQEEVFNGLLEMLVVAEKGWVADQPMLASILVMGLITPNCQNQELVLLLIWTRDPMLGMLECISSE